MFALNLPAFEYKIRQHDGKDQIYDPLRRRYVRLTSEEWVRQHFTHFLISQKGYPAGRMVHEALVVVNGQQKRCDTLVYDENLRPLVVLEYKAPEVTLNQKVFDQIASYNFVLKVQYLIVSNGLTHYCCRMDYQAHCVRYLTEMPAYTDL
jgi:hypothetical protein